MFKLTPKNDKFYDFFDRAADLTVECAEELLNFLNNFENPEEHAKKIKDIEHEADKNVHATMELLHKSFITPIERSDIRRLIRELDDIVDFMDGATSRIALYEVKEILPEAKTLAKVLVDATRAVRLAVLEIRNLSKNENILKHCVEINRLENEGDHIHHRALARLFKSGMDPLDVIKWKEIFYDIETSIDRCEDAADLLEGIVLENT